MGVQADGHCAGREQERHVYQEEGWQPAKAVREEEHPHQGLHDPHWAH